MKYEKNEEYDNMHIDYSKMVGNDILKIAVMDWKRRKKMAKWFEYSGEAVDCLMDMGMDEKTAIRALRTLLSVKNSELMHAKEPENLL